MDNLGLVLVIVGFFMVDLGLVIWALFRLSAHRQSQDITDMRHHGRRIGRIRRD